MIKDIYGYVIAGFILGLVFFSCLGLACSILAATQSFILFENHFYISHWQTWERAVSLFLAVVGLVAFIWKLNQ